MNAAVNFRAGNIFEELMGVCYRELLIANCQGGAGSFKREDEM